MALFRLNPTAPEFPAINLANTEEMTALGDRLVGVQLVVLNFPKFTDGRAYSQAFVLRRRGFDGDLRATGDVLVDQLLPMQRSGFSSAVLRADQDPQHRSVVRLGLQTERSEAGYWRDTGALSVP